MDGPRRPTELLRHDLLVSGVDHWPEDSFEPSISLSGGGSCSGGSPASFTDCHTSE
jgi:hypothetical protein